MYGRFAIFNETRGALGGLVGAAAGNAGVQPASTTIIARASTGALCNALISNGSPPGARIVRADNPRGDPRCAARLDLLQSRDFSSAARRLAGEARRPLAASEPGAEAGANGQQSHAQPEQGGRGVRQVARPGQSRWHLSGRLGWRG